MIAPSAPRTHARRSAPLRCGALCVALAMLACTLPASAARKPARPVTSTIEAAGLDGVRISSGRMREVLRQYRLPMLAGGQISVRELAGEVVVLHFWASWCPPCRRELPELDALHAELAGRGGRVLAVSIDNEAGNAERFAQRLRLKLPIAHDGPNGLARQLDLRHVPFTLVLDRNGEVAFATSRSDAAGVVAIGTIARRLATSRSLASDPEAGGKP